MTVRVSSSEEALEFDVYRQTGQETLVFSKSLALIALAATYLFLLAGMASATDYVPPSVGTTAAAAVTDPTIQVLGTSQVLGGSQGVATTPLAYTGSGINVGLVVLIGLIVLIVGIGLVIGGSRLTKRGSEQR